MFEGANMTNYEHVKRLVRWILGAFMLGMLAVFRRLPYNMDVEV